MMTTETTEYVRKAKSEIPRKLRAIAPINKVRMIKPDISFSRIEISPL